MGITNINLNLLSDVVYNGKYVDSIILNGKEIWNKNKIDKIYEVSVTASTSTLDVGNYPRTDLTYSNGIILTVGNSYIYKSTDFSSWIKTTSINSSYSVDRCSSDGASAFCINGNNGSRKFSKDSCSTWYSSKLLYGYTSLGYANGYFFMGTENNKMFYVSKLNVATEVSSSVVFDCLQYDDINKKYIYSSNNVISTSSSFSLEGEELYTCPSNVISLIVYGNKIFAIYKNGVSVSKDYGNTWTDKTLIDNDTDILLNAVLDTTDGKIVLVGANGCVYYTVNDFSTFHKCEYTNGTDLTFDIPKIFKAIDEDDLYVISNNTFTKCYKIKLTERTD